MDIFRTLFSVGPPAKLPPLEIDLKQDARPVKGRLQNYSQEQKEHMGEFDYDLVAHGMACPSPTSKWACATLHVPKPCTRFRFSVDLQPVSFFTVRHHFPTRSLEHELSGFKNAVFFANFDTSHGYWQLLLALLSQECQFFITPDGIFTLTRVIHSTTDALSYLQSSLTSIICGDLSANTLIWLEDILLHAPTVEILLESIRLFFELCAGYNIKLHSPKSILFTKEVR